MRSLLHRLKNVFIIITSVISGIFLFLVVLSLIFKNTVMTADFHKNMFEKNEVYSEAQRVIDSSREDVVRLIKGQSPELNEQQKEIIYILENSTSPEMVRINLDNINQDIFQYFNGKRRFLPDIYVDMKPPNLDDAYGENQTANSNYVSNRITRLNLNALIMSINRSDILEVFLLIKLVFFFVNSIPKFFIPAILFMLLIQMIISKRAGKIGKWLLYLCFSCSFLLIVFAICIYIYSHNMLPNLINEAALPIPINQDVLLSYIQDSVSLPALLCLLSGMFLFLLTYIFIIINKAVYKSVVNKRVFKFSFMKNHTKLLKYTLCTFLFAASIFGLAYNVHSFKKDFNANNFSNIVSKYTNYNSATEVVSAKNETIYTLQINLVDSDTNDPVENIEIKVDGKTETGDRHYNLSKVTDHEGTAKFHLGKGTFYIDFSSTQLSDNYIMPSPFYFDLTSVGTTIITINLDKYNEMENYGIVEIEILDENNEPFEGIEVFIENLKTNKNLEGEHKNSLEPPDENCLEPGTEPDRYFSITNLDGIAVFKMEEGTYKADFSEDKFPQEYIVPEPFSIKILPGIVSRYTIKLAKSE